MWLILAIVFAILAVVCLIAANYVTFTVIGTVVFAIAAVVCGLIYGGLI